MNIPRHSCKCAEYVMQKSNMPVFADPFCISLLSVFLLQLSILHPFSPHSFPLPLQNKFFRRRNPKDLLPAQPVEDVSFEWWWKVNIGYITEEDVKVSMTCSTTPGGSCCPQGVEVGPPTSSWERLRVSSRELLAKTFDVTKCFKCWLLPFLVHMAYRVCVKCVTVSIHTL